MDGRPRTYTIDELERDTGFDKRTIAYYVQEGLLPKVGRRGRRTRYPQLFIDRLRFIKRLRQMEEAGVVPVPLTLAEVRRIFEDAPLETIADIAAGDESFDAAYASWLHALAPSNVRFLGKLTRQEVWETLAQVDVVVVPSIWYETFSFLISEGFAAGTPVVASRLGPLADRVRDGIDGLLVPPGDVAAWQGALQRLADEPELLSRLRANVLRPMTQEEHVSRLESLYAELVERAAPCDN